MYFPISSGASKGLELGCLPKQLLRLLYKVFWIASTLVFWLILQLSYNGEKDICMSYVKLKQDCHDGGSVIATTSVEILLSSFEDQSRTLRKCLDGRESFISIYEEIS